MKVNSLKMSSKIIQARIDKEKLEDEKMRKTMQYRIKEGQQKQQRNRLKMSIAADEEFDDEEFDWGNNSQIRIAEEQQKKRDKEERKRKIVEENIITPESKRAKKSDLCHKCGKDVSTKQDGCKQHYAKKSKKNSSTKQGELKFRKWNLVGQCAVCLKG